jgi:hypothetical protein
MSPYSGAALPAGPAPAGQNGLRHSLACPPRPARNRAAVPARSGQAASSLICSISAIRSACVLAIGATFSVVTPDSFIAATRSAT